METYEKLSKKICGKCSEHCCTYQLDKGIEDIFVKKNEAIIHVLREKRNAKENCIVYHEGKCLAYDYRPAACRKHYCIIWDNFDKEIIIKGNIREASIEKIAKKIRFTANRMELNYLVFSKNCEKDAQMLMDISGIESMIDSNHSLKALEAFDKLKAQKIIVTNTSVDDFLKNVDFERGNIIQETALDGPFFMGSWFYTKNNILCRDLVKVL